MPISPLKSILTMKIKLICVALFALHFHVLSAQTEAPPVENVQPVELAAAPAAPEKTFELFDLEKPPVFQGGEAELYKFLGENIAYPDSAKIYGVRGTVIATFVINTNGSISDIVILRDIGRDCGEEVRRVLSLMPAWVPGEANGHKVKVRYTLPVRFKLD